MRGIVATVLAALAGVSMVATIAMSICCHAPAILGGPTPATTSHVCDDGASCPNGYDCPPLAGGNCEAPVDAPPAMREADAGSHCRMTMMGLVCLDERL